MENTRNKIPEYVQNFFEDLSKYLNTKLYFYGSVQRLDYIQNESDIDVDIFTDNEKSMITKMQHFLNVEKSNFKKVVLKIHNKHNIVYGYKLKYTDLVNNFKVEFSIYNEKYKVYVLESHLSKTNIPFYASWMLIFIKYLYYKLNIISKDYFLYLKKQILSWLIGINDDDIFVVLDEKI